MRRSATVPHAPSRRRARHNNQSRGIGGLTLAGGGMSYPPYGSLGSTFCFFPLAWEGCALAPPAHAGSSFLRFFVNPGGGSPLGYPFSELPAYPPW